MSLDQILMICLGCGALVVIIAWVVATFVKIIRMEPEQREEAVKTYLKGLIAWAEKEFTGSGRGAEKLLSVLENFSKNAPIFVRLIMLIGGVDSLEALIEKALKELKESFEK